MPTHHLPINSFQKKIPAKYLHSINTQILSVYSVSREAAVFCVFSVEFRGVCVFRGYSKQNQSKKSQKTFSTRNITEKVIWQNPQRLNQKWGAPVPASTGTLWMGSHPSCFEYRKQNRKRMKRSIVSTHLCPGACRNRYPQGRNNHRLSLIPQPCGKSNKTAEPRRDTYGKSTHELISYPDSM